MATILDQLGQGKVSNINGGDGTILDQLGTVELEGPKHAGVLESALDIGTAIPGALIGWPLSKLAGLTGLGVGTLMGEDPTVTKEASRDLENLVMSVFGEPMTKAGATVMEPIGKAFHALTTPTRWIDEQVSKWDPRAGYIAEFLAELALFKGIHSTGSFAFGKLKNLRGAKSQVELKAELDSIAEEFGDLSTAEGRQAHINRMKSDAQVAKETPLTREEVHQQLIDEVPEGEFVSGEGIGKAARVKEVSDVLVQREDIAARDVAGARPIGEIITEKTAGAKELLDPDVKVTQLETPKVEAAEPSQIIRRGQEEVRRTNVEAQRAVEQQRDVQRRLDEGIVKEEPKPVEEPQTRTHDEIVKEAIKDVEAEVKLEDTSQLQRPVVREALKESEVPKGEEPVDYVQVRSREFKPEDVKKSEGVESVVVDDLIEYDLYGKRKFSTAKEAQKVIDTEKKIQGIRNELQAAGTDLEIVKVGEKYRIAEPMKATPEEQAVITDYLRAKTRGEVAIEELDPKTAEAELRQMGEQVKRWHQGDESVDIAELEGRIAEVSSSFQQGKTDPATQFLVEAGDKMLELIRREKTNIYEPKPAEGNPELMVAKSPANRDLDLAYSREGKPFGDMYEAMEWNKVKNIGGVVEKHPDGKGWVIELREPKRIDVKEVPPGELIEKSLSPEGRALRDIFKDIVEALPKVDPNALSSFPGIKFKDIKPSQVEAIRRLAQDARRAGKGVAEFAKSLGYTDAQARGFGDLVREVSRNIEMEMPQNGTRDFEYGRTVNTGKTEWMQGGVKVSVPKISEAKLSALKEAEILQRRFGGLTREFVTTPQAVEDFKSPLVKAYHQMYQELEGMIDKKVKALSQELSQREKGVDRGSSERIGLHALAKQAGVMERLKRQGITEKDIPKLTEGETQVYNWMRGELEGAYSDINKTRAKTGHGAMKKVPDYFTLMYSEGMAEKAGLKPNIFMDSIDVVDGRYVQFKENPFRFAKSRSKKGLLKEISFDSFDIFDKYMRNKVRYEHLSPLVRELAELREPLKDGAGIFKLGEHNPSLDSFIRRWSNTLAGRDVDFAFSSPAGRALERGISKITRNMAVSVLGFMARSAAIQVSALRNTYAMLGPKFTLEGVMEIFKPGRAESAMRQSKILETRKSEAILDSWFREASRGRIEKVGRASLYPLQYLDVKTAAATWHGAHKYATRKLEMKGDTAVKFADEMVTKTQASSLPGDLAPIQRSVLGKAITLFQTFTISDWNLMYKDVFGIGRDVPAKTKFKRIVNYTIATTLFNMFFEDVLQVNSPFPTPLRTLSRSMEAGDDPERTALLMGKEFIEPIPILGSARYGSNFLGSFAQAVGDLSASVSGKQMSKPLWESGGKFLPAPGLAQFAKSLRGYKKDANVYEIIMGPNPNKREKKKSGFGKF